MKGIWWRFGSNDKPSWQLTQAQICYRDCGSSPPFPQFSRESWSAFVPLQVDCLMNKTWLLAFSCWAITVASIFWRRWNVNCSVPSRGWGLGPSIMLSRLCLRKHDNIRSLHWWYLWSSRIIVTLLVAALSVEPGMADVLSWWIKEQFTNKTGDVSGDGREFLTE